MYTIFKIKEKLSPLRKIGLKFVLFKLSYHLIIISPAYVRPNAWHRPLKMRGLGPKLPHRSSVDQVLQTHN